MPDQGYMDAAAVPVPDAGDDTLREQLAEGIAAALTERGFMGWFVANANSDLWAERTPEQEIGRVAAENALPLIRERTANAEDAFEQVRAILTDPPAELVAELAEDVHQAYLDTCERLGWSVRPENAVPYAELSDDSQELDRATVRAVASGLASALDGETDDDR